MKDIIATIVAIPLALIWIVFRLMLAVLPIMAGIWLWENLF